MEAIPRERDTPDDHEKGNEEENNKASEFGFLLTKGDETPESTEAVVNSSYIPDAVRSNSCPMVFIDIPSGDYFRAHQSSDVNSSRLTGLMISTNGTTPSISLRKKIEMARSRCTYSQFLMYIAEVSLEAVENSIMLDVLWIAFNFMMLAFGFHYLNDCRAETLIPVYLVEGGIIGLLGTCVSISNHCNSSSFHHIGIMVVRAIRCFLFAWSIPGFIWVFRILPPETKNRNRINFCDPNLYYFSFVIAIFGLLPFVIIPIEILATVFFYYSTKKTPGPMDFQPSAQ